MPAIKDNERVHWIRVWDLPTRVFHWSLVLLVAISVYTGNIGGLREMDLHKLAGYAVLVLIVFRFVWGLVGSRHSRFAEFLRGPRVVVSYARSLMGGAPIGLIGHNPMGGWSVVAMLASLLLQAASGLFARDDIFTEGPLVRYVSKGASRTLTAIHHLNATILYVLVSLHLLAVLYYLIVRRENLVWPMLTGRKVATPDSEQLDVEYARSWMAAVILAAAAGAVWLLVSR